MSSSLPRLVGRLDVCFECGSEKDHDHHVVPRSLGGTRTVPLCWECHSKIHGRKISSRSLTLQGLERAKKNGRIGGRPKAIKQEDHAKIMELKNAGVVGAEIARQIGVHPSTICRFLQSFSPNQGS